jgi:hypothetical protein
MAKGSRKKNAVFQKTCAGRAKLDKSGQIWYTIENLTHFGETESLALPILAHPTSPLIWYRTIQESVLDGIWHMIGGVQQKPGHCFGHDDLADSFGVNTVLSREALRHAQAEAQSTLHRRRDARTAKLSVADCADSYRIKKAGETLVCPWAGVDTIFLF